MRLKIELVTKNEKKLLATLKDSRALVGRDLTCDVPLPSQAVSRAHGLFLPFETGWAYLDKGSTNGSWINGQKVDAYTFCQISDADYLQLADQVLKLTYETRLFGDSVVRKVGWRLFILHGNPQENKFSTAELNPLDFDGFVTSPNGVSFELVNDEFFILAEQPIQHPILLNNKEIIEKTKLKKFDYIQCQDFQFLVIHGELVTHKPTATSSVIVPPNVQTNLDLTAVGEAKVFSPQATSIIEPSQIRKVRFGERPQLIDEEDISKSENIGFFKGLYYYFLRLPDLEKKMILLAFFFLIVSILFLIFLLLI